jgi:hypothetical protein
MEFKGTKGKWEFCKTHQTITDHKGYGIAQENGIRNSNEWKANALLISKAPEMLEMLEKFVKAIEAEEIIIKENFDNDGYENCGNRLYNEFKQLIKEATEL